jgi:hypothetical protein
MINITLQTYIEYGFYSDKKSVNPDKICRIHTAVSLKGPFARKAPLQSLTQVLFFLQIFFEEGLKLVERDVLHSVVQIHMPCAWNNIEFLLFAR